MCHCSRNNEDNRTPAKGGLRWPASLLLLALMCPLPVDAQEPDEPLQRFRESVSLDTDIAVTKKLKTAEDYLAAQQWESAIQVLTAIIEGDAETLVAAGPGRYVSAGTYCHSLLSRLPAEGMTLYRRQTDPQARQWFETGSRQRDERLLQRVLRRAFASSYGDDALLTLGDWAWERGDLDVARRYWQQLLPVADDSSEVLRYPDPEVAGADVMVRMLVASLAAADMSGARRELLLLRKSFPDATGEVAGRQGNLAEIAETLVQEANSWHYPSTVADAETFGGTVQRYQMLPKGVDVGAEKWSVQFSGRDAERFKFASRQPAFAGQPALSVYPVIHDGLVLFNDADRIYAYDLKSGKPAWPGLEDDSDNGVIYQMRDRLFPVASRSAVGVPRYSMTVHHGRLYARMGTPITSRSERELIADTESALVVLDLDPVRGQGKLLAKISADHVGRGTSMWSFEGSPVVDDDHIYIAMRRSQPEMQINVACFHGDSGRLIWNRKVCAAVSNIGRANNLITQQLLTMAEDKIFISTDLGAVAALDRRDGSPLWTMTYESLPPESLASLSDHTRQGLLPCLYHQATVYCAPNDSDQVYAIDAQSGAIRWQRQLDDTVRHLMGVAAGNLVVGGNSLWGLNIQTGTIAWGRETSDPEFYGYGRGLLVDGTIWWPTRKTIEIRSPLTGHRIRRQPILLSAHSTTTAAKTGGNLAISGGCLVVAQADRLVVYGESPLPVMPAGRELSLVFPRHFFRATEQTPRNRRTQHILPQ